VGRLALYSFPHPFLFVVKLASHPPNPVRALEETAVGQSVAYATDTGEVTVGDYYQWNPPIDGTTGYYNPNDYDNSIVDTNDTVVLYSPTQRPQSLSFMMSESYTQNVEAEWDNTHQRTIGGVNPFEPYPPAFENFSITGGSMVQADGIQMPLWILPPPQRMLVPQRQYTIKSNGKRRFNPELPITFAVGDQSGMPLQDAMDERYEGLVGRDDGMFIGRERTAISLRIEWPKYKAWTRHINTVDWKKSRGPITRSKLAFKIAKVIDSFIKSNQETDVGDEAWRVGNGYIELKDLVLDSIEHVTKGSWQPQIFVMRQ